MEISEERQFLKYFFEKMMVSLKERENTSFSIPCTLFLKQLHYHRVVFLTSIVFRFSWSYSSLLTLKNYITLYVHSSKSRLRKTVKESFQVHPLFFGVFRFFRKFSQKALASSSYFFTWGNVASLELSNIPLLYFPEKRPMRGESTLCFGKTRIDQTHESPPIDPGWWEDTCGIIFATAP